MLAEHRIPGKAILVKRPPFDPRHDPGSEQCSPKTQHAVQQEICGKPSNMFLIVEEYGQEPEEELAETEEKKYKHRKTPAHPNSLRASKNRLHFSMSSAIHRPGQSITAAWYGSIGRDVPCRFRKIGHSSFRKFWHARR